jgi:hypothetical protein
MLRAGGSHHGRRSGRPQRYHRHRRSRGVNRSSRHHNTIRQLVRCGVRQFSLRLLVVVVVGVLQHNSRSSSSGVHPHLSSNHSSSGVLPHLNSNHSSAQLIRLPRPTHSAAWRRHSLHSRHRQRHRCAPALIPKRGSPCSELASDAHASRGKCQRAFHALARVCAVRSTRSSHVAHVRLHPELPAHQTLTDRETLHEAAQSLHRACCVATWPQLCST